MLKGCIELGMVLRACSRSSEDYTAASVLGVAAATGHSAAGCTSGAIDSRQRTMMHTRLPVEKRQYCFGVRSATAAPALPHVAGCT